VSLTAAAVKFARVQDGAAEYRRSTSPAPVADIVETLNDWTLKEDAAFEELADALALSGYPIRRQAS
jgi:hypothetical protein